MSVKRVLNIFKFDLINGLRDKMTLYMLVAPIFMAFVVRLLVPGVQSVSITFVTLESEEQLVEKLSDYGTVYTARNLDEMHQMIRDQGGLFGVEGTDYGYSLILFGNESDDEVAIAQTVIASLVNGFDPLDRFEIADLGKTLSPVALIFFIFVVVISFLLGGLAIGFNLIDEKETNAIKGLAVTPMRGLELILGHSIMGAVLPVIHALVAILILGLLDVEIGKLVLVTVVSSPVGIITGFFIGVSSGNQMAGIANMKVGNTFLLIPVVLAFILPETRHVFLYWIPTYWSYAALNDILLRSADWSSFSRQILWLLLTTGLFAALLGTKIRSGLKTYLG